MKTFLKYCRPSLVFCRKVLVQLAIITLLFEQFIFVSIATAQTLPLNIDGSTNTRIDAAANGVPIVNIAAPNSSGLSHNRFSDYNVNSQGLILNNSAGNANGVVQTQIGGLIAGNSNLANSGAASVILNEVTSNRVSQLNGYTEIAGRRADLIVANPNGISMAGAGFINVSRFTAVVGSVNGAGAGGFGGRASDLTFSLSGNDYRIANGFLPSLTISGAGLDLEAVSSTDLVAGVMNIVAPIYGGENEVNLRAGDDGFNYGSKVVSSSGVGVGNNLPTEVAIDASVLGKIQAGKIFIIATKEGFGIKYSGDLLASRNGIVIDSRGNVEYNNIAAEVGDVEVVSRNGGIVGNGVVQTKDAGFDIKLNAAGDIINRGQFLSAKDINIETLGEFRNESLALNLSDNDFTINAVDFVNLGQISAGRDLSVEATTLVNSAKLVGGRNLSLTAARITNDDSIYANNKITISASDYFTNDGDVVSIGEGLVDGVVGIDNSDDGIVISAKTLNNNKQIAAKNNIVINSNILNNNTANSTVLGLNDVGLNVVEVDNSGAEIVAGNNLVLRNLVLSEPTIANSFGVNSQATTITNAGGSFFAGNFLDFDLGNLADYVMVGTLESAGDIKIKANNITNKTSVKANGDIEIIADDKFTNGVFGGDNSGNKIIAGDSLNITATNLLSNYGTVSSQNNLTLASTFGNINNNASAEIIGGSGKLSLVARNGTVNQNSLNSIVSNGDYDLDVVNFINTGRVDVAGNLTLNVSNNLVNEAAAMIYSGGDMELNVVNNLTNKTGAVIYSEGDLVIQKYALTNPNYDVLDNRINQFDNISGDIISYEGNMVIRATTLNNKRNLDPAIWLIKPDRAGGGAYYYSWGDGQYDLKFTNHNLYNWTFLRERNFGDGEHQAQYVANAPIQAASREANIFSGGTLTLDSVTILNDTSNILSSGDLTIDADVLVNQSKNYPQLIYMATSGRHNEYSDNASDFAGDFSPIALNGDKVFSALIKSGGSFHGTGFDELENVIISPNYTKGNLTKFNENVSDANNVLDGTDVNGSDKERDRVEVNSVDVERLTQDGIIDINLDRYFDGPAENGLFQRSNNPSGPLFESRSQFVDQSKFFGSDYFYQRIGLDLDEVQTEFEQNHQRLVGDQFFQSRIIAQQLATITKNSYLLSANENNVNDEIKSLLDNAADEYARLGLNANGVLSQAQINGLQKDIIWFETQTIDGAVYIVPKIYLTQATRDGIKNGNIASKSTIYAAGDVNIAARESVSNTGSIVAGNNVALSAGGDILNKNFSDIIAGNNLTLNSDGGSIVNLSQINAGGVASLTAAGDVVNSSTVLTNDAALLASSDFGYVSGGMAAANSGNIYSEVLETAGISAGSLVVNAGGDFRNLAAGVTTTKNDLVGGGTSDGNIEITAGDDIIVSTLELRNRTETHSGRGNNSNITIVDTRTNIGSDISAAGNIALATTGTGADLEGLKILEINTQRLSQIEILEEQISQLEIQKLSLPASSQILRKKTERDIIDAQISSLRAQIDEANNNFNENISPLILNFGSNINITGSIISSQGDVNINAENNINILNAVDSSYRHHESQKKGSTRTVKSVQTDYVETAVVSEISGENINLSANNDILIQASNIDTDNDFTVGRLALNVDGDGSYQKDGDGNYITTSSEIVDNLTIQNATLNEYHFAHTSRQYNGIAKVGAQVVSSTIGIADLYLNLVNNLLKPITKELDDHIQKVSAKYLPDSIVEKIDANYFQDKKNDAKDTSLYNIKQKTFETSQRTNVVSSNLTIGNNFDVKAEENVVIQASNISAGVADLTVDKSDNAVEGKISVESDNLYILAANESELSTEEIKKTRTLMFNNTTSGNMNTEVINTQMSAKNDDFEFNIANEITLSYNQNDFNEETGKVNNGAVNQMNLSYLSAIKNDNDRNFGGNNLVNYIPMENISLDWTDTTRGLTDAGTAVVAVGAVVATIVTAGAAGVAIGTGATLGGTVLVATASTAASTAALSATNTSMNAEGDFFKQAKDVGKQTIKDTTSKESLENIAIAGLTAAVTFGIAQGLDSLSNSGNAAGGVSGSTSVTQLPPVDTSFTTLNLGGVPVSNFAASGVNNVTLTSRFLTALQNSAIQTVSSTAVQSAVKGDDFGDAFKNQLTQLLINAVGQVAANEIGGAYHSAEISKPTQLVLHAGLGCAMAAAGGNNCGAGAFAGVVGESFGELVYNNGNGLSRQNTIAASQVAGALAGAMIAGPDDGDSVFAGSQVGRNAAENNLTMVIPGTDPLGRKSSSKDFDQKFRNSVENTFDEKITDFEWSGGNTKEARSEAAINLNNFISSYDFKEGEKLNIIMFSHGGNGGKEWTQIYTGPKKIDNMIFLGTPHRYDYKLDYSDLSPNANLINIYSLQDGVQPKGYIDGNVLRGIITTPDQNLRFISGFNNIEVDQSRYNKNLDWKTGLIYYAPPNPISGHSNLHSAPVWNQYVDPLIK